MSDNPLTEFVLRYRDDPVLFVKEVLGRRAIRLPIRVSQCPYHLASVKCLSDLGMVQASQHPRLGLCSGFLLLRFPNKVVVTAPTSSQLFDALFAELKRWINELPPPPTAIAHC